jgi:hypothetical protein
MQFNIPKPVQIEHEELARELQAVAEVGGRIGETAKTVAYIMEAHFQKEEQLVLPALGLLPLLAQGKVTADMKPILELIDAFKLELPQMMNEHKAMKAALRMLIVTARKEQNPWSGHFAEKLLWHLQTEEEIRYPTAILVGEYLRLKLNPLALS